MKHSYGKLILPSLFTFIFITIVFVGFHNFLDGHNINHKVVVVGNLLLFLLSTLTLWMHLRAVKNPNPNVFTNSVMGGTVLKLFVLAIATVIYFVLVGKDKSVFAIFTNMFLYIIYTVLDVRAALILNKKK
jgi:hypothetical protein